MQLDGLNVPETLSSAFRFPAAHPAAGAIAGSSEAGAPGTARGRLEYRLSLFQGVRGVEARSGLLWAGRVVQAGRHDADRVDPPRWRALHHQLPQADVILAEAGYHLAQGRFTPFVQYSNRNLDIDSTPDQDAFPVGLACWLEGHARNLKASIGQQHTIGQSHRLQGLVQLQIFSY